MRPANLLAAILLCSALPAAAQSHREMALADQLSLFLEWFPGRYDSALQQRMDALDNVPETQRNYRRHSIFRRVDLPQFGDTVFYAEQYRDGDADKIYRQRIYTFTLAPDENAFRLRVHVPEDPGSLRGAYRDPSLLTDLKPTETKVWDGCDLFWRWHGDRFRGELKPGACRFQSRAFGQEIVLEEYLVLGPDYIHFADRGLALDGSYLFGMRGDVPNKSLKVSWFRCAADNAGEAEPRDLRVHDQGQIVPVGQRSMALRIQDWSKTMQDRGLELELLDGNGALLAAAKADPETDMVGLTAAGVDVSCTRRRDWPF